MKRNFALLAVLCTLALCAVTGALAQEEIRGYDKSKGGYQYVQLGVYPFDEDGTEKPVLWRVLGVEENQALLLSEYVLDTQQVIFVQDEKDIKNYNYRKINDYSESDLCGWMNDTMLTTLLGQDTLKNALVEGAFGKLYPLTAEQFLRTDYGFNKAIYHENKPRKALATPYCETQRGCYVYRDTSTATYWVATIKTPKGYKLQIVGYDGHLSWGVYSRKNIGIRPAVTLDLNLCAVSGGSGTMEDPFVMAYTGQRDVDLGSSFETEAPQTQAAIPAPVAQIRLEKLSNVPSTSPSNENSLTLSFVGDCSVGDATQSRSQPSSLTSMVAKNGYDWIFSDVSEYLTKDDCTFANLEVNFTTQEKFKSSKKYNMIAPPEHVQILQEGGIDAVNTVNNHCMDFTEVGYRDTLKTLDEAQITHFGTVYPGMERGSDILGRLEIKGVKIGMIGFSYPSDSDLKRISSRIDTLKEEGCDLVVVSLHWGRETHMTSENWQFSYAKKVIDAGADVIWGHHPHVVQPIMFYQGKPVFFSTGNFVFGTMSDVDPSTGIFQLHYEISADGKPVLSTLRVIPCQTRGSGDYRPYELTEQSAREACLKKLVSKKNIKNMVNLPQSFVTTGIVNISKDGTILSEE